MKVFFDGAKRLAVGDNGTVLAREKTESLARNCGEAREKLMQESTLSTSRTTNQTNPALDFTTPHAAARPEELARLDTALAQQEAKRATAPSNPHFLHIAPDSWQPEQVVEVLLAKHEAEGSRYEMGCSSGHVHLPDFEAVWPMRSGQGQWVFAGTDLILSAASSAEVAEALGVPWPQNAPVTAREAALLAAAAQFLFMSTIAPGNPHAQEKNVLRAALAAYSNSDGDAPLPACRHVLSLPPCCPGCNWRPLWRWRRRSWL